MLLTTFSWEYKLKYDLMQMLANAKSPKKASVLSMVLRGGGIITFMLYLVKSDPFCSEVATDFANRHFDVKNHLGQMTKQ